MFKKHIKAADWLAIPNLLSLVRIIMIPFFMFYYFTAETQADYLWSAFIVLLSGITDWLDGVIARRFDMITDLGKLLDPAADKLTQLAIIICLITTWQYMWILIIILLIKEFSMLYFSIKLYQKGKIMDGSLWYGKVATFVFYGSALILVAFPMIHPVAANLLMLLTGITLFLAFALYTRWFLIQFKQSTTLAE